jgi:hypothetical protein
VKRSFLGFLLLVVLPAGACMVVAHAMAAEAWESLLRESHVRVARMVLATSARERSAGPDPGAGGTGAGPEAPLRVGRSTGYRVALYRDGRRWAATEPPPGPERIPDSVAARLAPGAVVPVEGQGEGVWMPGRPGVAPDGWTAWAAPRTPADPLIAPAVGIVMLLLLLFGALTGWIQLTRRGLHARTLALGGVVGPALVPGLSTLVFLIHVDRAFTEAAPEAVARDVGRAVAVAAAVGIERDPEAVRAVTGVHATRVRDGQVVSTTLPGDPAAVGALPSPPASFTSSGRIVTAGGPAAWVALRLDEGEFLAATELLPERPVARLRRSVFLLGLLLALAWTLAAGAAWLLSRRRTSAEVRSP